MTTAIEIKEYDERAKAANAYGAVLDIKRRDQQNRDNFSADLCKLAAEIENIARSSYIRSRVWLNYREKFIAVKVENVQFADKISKEVEFLNQWCADHGVEIVSIGKNIVYRVKEK